MIPITAGAIVAPEMHITDCAPATTQKFREVRITAEAATAAKPTTMTQARLRLVASTKAPAGATVNIPTIAPNVITAPMALVLQPRPASNTPRKGPMPASISAMKKFTARSAARSRTASLGAGMFQVGTP
ncbi:hypothetical protein LAUMK41_04638 [Mycobacterium attenuatum]|nr:hypothetical protein [Mycobacterium attenuatum]VBA61262.1 hypothetical protein LAUMK41_04638 [Mycobacterium attenuatum]